MSQVRPSTRLLGQVMRSNTDAELAALLARRRANALEGLAELLEDLSLDSATFYGLHAVTRAQLQVKLDELIAGDCEISEWTASLVVFSRGIDLSSKFGRSGATPDPAEVAALKRAVLRAPGLAATLRHLYDLPARPSVGHRPFSWSTLCLHALGTSSLVFRIEDDADNRYALKLSHVLFRKVGPVADATTGYFERWGDLSRKCDSIVRVHASGRGWVIQEFVDGWTLREVLEGRVEDLDVPTGPAAMRQILGPIVRAVQQLHDSSAGLGHGDLCPSNVIVTKAATTVGHQPWPVKLIDMGPNLLSSDTVGRVTAAEARFTAPEVRRDYPAVVEVSPAADLFSLGHLIPYCAGYRGVDGFYNFDERIYADEPDLARLSARLVSNDEKKRLELVDANFLSDLPDLAVKVATLTAAFDPSTLNSNERLFFHSVFGTWGAVWGAAKQVYEVARRWRTGNNRYREVAPPLRICFAALGFAVGAFIVVWTAALQAHVIPDSAGQAFTSLGYRTHPAAQNWQVRAVGASFLVACFQYDLRAFGGVTLLGTTLRQRTKVASEGLLWLLTVIVLIAIAVCTFGAPHLWPICSAVGVTVVAVNNLVHGRARDHVRRALLGDQLEKVRERHSGNGDGETAGHTVDWIGRSRILQKGHKDILDYWTPTCLTFAVVLLVLGALAMAGAIHDWSIWAGAITAVNVVIFSYSQATKQGPDVRVELQQYVVLASAGSV